jgi:heme-degrading monooxygenase HmoA
MIYRVGMFTVPEKARREFERRSFEAIALLRTQPGFVNDQWLDRIEGDSEITIITIAAWQDEASVAAAGEAIKAMHAEVGFDPKAFAAEQGIRRRDATYRMHEPQSVQS